MRQLALITACFALAGCAMSSANTLPDPRVVEIASVPDDATVDADCGAYREHGPAPLRFKLPPHAGTCTVTVSKAGYATETLAVDAVFVMKQGEPLRMDEHHVLRPDATPIDAALLPLQRWMDRKQDALQRHFIPDYRLTVRLRPSVTQ